MRKPAATAALPHSERKKHMTAENTGALIRLLRLKKGLTQKQLADALCVSDKAVSKWEVGNGLPDISLLTGLAELLGVEPGRLLSGEAPDLAVPGGNMKNIKFYVCPDCGNLATATSAAQVSCCGKPLVERIPQKASGSHMLDVEPVEDEWFITSGHEMSKQHHISFVAFATSERLLTVRQYPEWELQLRLPKMGRGKLFFGCKEHGVFYQLL